MRSSFVLLIWVICYYGNLVRSDMHINSPKILNNWNDNGLFEVWSDKTFATGVNDGELNAEGSESNVRNECLSQCLQHALCGSVSVKDTEPYRCLWSRYALYAPQLGQSAPGWTLYTRTKGNSRLKINLCIIYKPS